MIPLIHRIDGHHPLSLDTEVRDREGKNVYTLYIDVYYREIIKAEICLNPHVKDYRNIKWITLHREKEEDLGLDYYIFGIKNPDIDHVMRVRYGLK